MESFQIAVKVAGMKINSYISKKNSSNDTRVQQSLRVTISSEMEVACIWEQNILAISKLYS